MSRVIQHTPARGASMEQHPALLLEDISQIVFLRPSVPQSEKKNLITVETQEKLVHNILISNRIFV